MLMLLQVILLSDGSVTRHLKLMTNLDVIAVSSSVVTIFIGSKWEVSTSCNDAAMSKIC